MDKRLTKKEIEELFCEYECALSPDKCSVDGCFRLGRFKSIAEQKELFKE